MNRDELLTKLAMELGEWPTEPVGRMGAAFMPVHEYVIEIDGCRAISFTYEQYLQRRAELINKPSWDDAPKKAEWLAQDADGKWFWFSSRPEMVLSHWKGFMDVVGNVIDGQCPNGHDWRQTLEARPDFDESRADAIGQNGNDGLHYMTPEEEELPAQEKHDCDRCGGCYYSPPHDACPCTSGIEDYVSGDKPWPEKYWHTTTADSILAAARQHMIDRASTYDKPEGERSMNSTVLAFAAVTGVLMTEEQGWLFMQLLKAVRSQQGDYRADSYEDGAAYVALAGEAAARDRKNQ